MTNCVLPNNITNNLYILTDPNADPVYTLVNYNKNVSRVDTIVTHNTLVKLSRIYDIITDIKFTVKNEDKINERLDGNRLECFSTLRLGDINTSRAPSNNEYFNIHDTPYCRSYIQIFNKNNILCGYDVTYRGFTLLGRDRKSLGNHIQSCDVKISNGCANVGSPYQHSSDIKFIMTSIDDIKSRIGTALPYPSHSCIMENCYERTTKCNICNATDVLYCVDHSDNIINKQYLICKSCDYNIRNSYYGILPKDEKSNSINYICNDCGQSESKKDSSLIFKDRSDRIMNIEQCKNCKAVTYLLHLVGGNHSVPFDSF
jgi:hypothetical protein